MNAFLLTVSLPACEPGPDGIEDTAPPEGTNRTGSLPEQEWDTTGCQWLRVTARNTSKDTALLLFVRLEEEDYELDGTFTRSGDVGVGTASSLWVVQDSDLIESGSVFEDCAQYLTDSPKEFWGGDWYEAESAAWTATLTFLYERDYGCSRTRNFDAVLELPDFVAARGSSTLEVAAMTLHAPRVGWSDCGG
jgi:hypothetical protein